MSIKHVTQLLGFVAGTRPGGVRVHRRVARDRPVPRAFAFAITLAVPVAVTHAFARAHAFTRPEPVTRPVAVAGSDAFAVARSDAFTVALAVTIALP